MYRIQKAKLALIILVWGSFPALLLAHQTTYTQAPKSQNQFLSRIVPNRADGTLTHRNDPNATAAHESQLSVAKSAEQILWGENCEDFLNKILDNPDKGWKEFSDAGELTGGGMAVVGFSRVTPLQKEIAFKAARSTNDIAGDIRAFEALSKEFLIMINLAQTAAAKFVPKVLGYAVLPAKGPLIIMKRYKKDLSEAVTSGEYGPYKKNPGGSSRAHHMKILKLGYELSSGLAAIHKEGVFHRDIKPSNFLIGEDGEIVISDFGLAVDNGELVPEKTAANKVVETLQNEDSEDARETAIGTGRKAAIGASNASGEVELAKVVKKVAKELSENGSEELVGGSPMYLLPVTTGAPLVNLTGDWPAEGNPFSRVQSNEKERNSLREKADDYALMLTLMDVTQGVTRNELQTSAASDDIGLEVFVGPTERQVRKVSVISPYEKHKYNAKTGVGVLPSASVLAQTYFGSAEKRAEAYKVAIKYLEKGYSPGRFFKEYYGPKILAPLIEDHPEEAAKAVQGLAELRERFNATWIYWKNPLGLTKAQFVELRNALQAQANEASNVIVEGELVDPDAETKGRSGPGKTFQPPPVPPAPHSAQKIINALNGVSWTR